MLSTSKQRDPPQDAPHRSPSAHHQQEQKQPTALLRTFGCTGRTHSPAATPDFFAPLRKIGCPDGLTRLQPRRSTAHPRIIGYPDGFTRLRPRRSTAHPRIIGCRDGLTRLHPRRTSAQLRTTSCPGRTRSPAVSPNQPAHLRRSTTQAPKRR